MSEKYYTIKVGGEKPLEVQAGTINKLNGQPGPDAVAAVAMVGEIAIPNYSVIWAKEGKKGDKLTGEITPLEWGADGGGLVELRYLKNCQSINKRYQEQEKFRVTNEDSEISLYIGLNEFSERTQKNLCLMLQLHTYNGSNVSRDPTKHHIRFTNYEPEKVMNVQASFIELRQNAETLVIQSKFHRKKLENMAVIFDLDKRQLDETIFNQLLTFTQKPDLFWEIMNAEKAKFNNTLSKSLELGLIDMGVPNVVMLVRNGKKDYLIDSETPIEGDSNAEKIKFMLGNLIEPAIFEGLNLLFAELQKYETANLQ